jgi:hypothetical protein
MRGSIARTVRPLGALLRRPVLLLSTAALTVALLIVVAAPGRAGADGDPASDYLTQQPTFVPPDAGTTLGQRLELDKLIAEAAAHGVHLRVAVIASPTDLGSISMLWRKPAEYAHFLGTELSLTFAGTLLVVMPGGVGVATVGRARPLRLGAMPTPRTRLGPAAIAAVRSVAAAAGAPLAATAIAPSAHHAPANPLPLLVFLVGLVAVALAWTASIRARPLKGP